jgi:hypothetical protein
MPKVKISEYSATANSNTDVASINIDEGCAPSGINNAIRAVMGHLKDFQQGTYGDPFNGPVNGTVGATTPSTGAFTTLSATGNVTLGDASTDTLNVGNGGLIKDASGNLGLGVTPSAWQSSLGSRAIQFTGSAVYGYRDTNLILTQNAYFDGAFKYYASSIAAGYYGIGAGVHSWYTAASGTAGNAITFTQAMTLDASGNLGIGTTSPVTKLDVNGAIYGRGDIYVNATSASIVDINGGYGLKIVGGGSGHLDFQTNGSERARIDSSGNLLVGKTSTSFSTAGMTFTPGGLSELVASSSTVIAVNRLATDGTLIDFYQAGTKEGDISVSGTTVSYNGGHLSRYAQTIAVKDETILKGTVLSNLDEMNVYTKDEQPVANEQLNKVKVSDTEGDANVAGVFVNWSHDEDHNVEEINMAMTGDMIIRIAQGVTVARGDLLMSAGDGTAKPQGDDIVRSKTVAKVTSTHVTCTYADGSYCVPCVLMAC